MIVGLVVGVLIPIFILLGIDGNYCNYTNKLELASGNTHKEYLIWLLYTYNYSDHNKVRQVEMLF